MNSFYKTYSEKIINNFKLTVLNLLKILKAFLKIEKLTWIPILIYIKLLKSMNTQKSGNIDILSIDLI